MIKLMEWVVDVLKSCRPLVVIPEYEGGVHLRLGRYKRTLQPGPHLLIPFVDSILTTEIKPRWTETGNVSVEVEGRRLPVAASGALEYRISDPAKALLQVDDCEESLAYLVEGLMVSEIGRGGSVKEIRQRFLARLTPEAAKYGVEALRFRFSTYCPHRALRILGDSPAALESPSDSP